MSKVISGGNVIDCGNGFLSIRGSFKAGGLVDVGTHCALVELAPGRFVFLDSYTLDDETLARINTLTEGGSQVEAILNLHPFHTLHCEWMHKAFPSARLYGTARHKDQLPGLPWEDITCEDEALAQIYGEWFDFTVPRGTALVCESETVHFASVLALHRASGTIHVDDTLSYLDKGFPLSLLPMTGRLDFHPTLPKALEPRGGAAAEFAAWARDLARDWSQANKVACAHNAIVALQPGEFTPLVQQALERVEPVLEKHRKQYG